MATLPASPLERVCRAFHFIKTAATAAANATPNEAALDARVGQQKEETMTGIPRRNTALDRSAGAATDDAPPTPPTMPGTGQEQSPAQPTMISPEFAQEVLQELQQDRQDWQEIQETMRDAMYHIMEAQESSAPLTPQMPAHHISAASGFEPFNAPLVVQQKIQQDM